MAIDRKKIISLANKHFFSLTEKQIDALLFEIENFTLPKIKKWKQLHHLFNHLPPTDCPSFITLEINDLDPNFSHLTNENVALNFEKVKKHFVVLAKVDQQSFPFDE